MFNNNYQLTLDMGISETEHYLSLDSPTGLNLSSHLCQAGKLCQQKTFFSSIYLFIKKKKIKRERFKISIHFHAAPVVWFLQTEICLKDAGWNAGCQDCCISYTNLRVCVAALHVFSPFTSTPEKTRYGLVLYRTQW